MLWFQAWNFIWLLESRGGSNGSIICKILAPRIQVWNFFWCETFKNYNLLKSIKNNHRSKKIFNLNDIQQRQITGVKSDFDRTVFLHCLVRHFPFFILKGQHHKSSQECSQCVNYKKFDLRSSKTGSRLWISNKITAPCCTLMTPSNTSPHMYIPGLKWGEKWIWNIFYIYLNI